MISSKTHTANLVKEKNSIQMYEITEGATGKQARLLGCWEDK